MRYASLASRAGSTGIGESLLKTTDPPTARTAPHGQLLRHEAFKEPTTLTDVTGVPSLKRTPGRSRNCQRWRSFSAFQSAASPGVTKPPESMRVRPA